MSAFNRFCLASLILAGPAVAADPPKVVHPEKVDPQSIGQAPYKFTGVVLSEIGRGSGFCAWHPKAYFSAAHVVFDEDAGWMVPPVFAPGVNGDTVEPEAEIATRGYFRWHAYGDAVTAYGNSHRLSFSKDVILGYSLENLAGGETATLNLTGYQDLRKGVRSLITGYPAVIDYTDEENTYFMYETGPANLSWQVAATRYLTSPLVSTGPGNSGGPIWTEKKPGQWTAAGVLVSGLGGEAGVYSLSSDVNKLTRSAAPVLKDVPGNPISVSGVDRTSFVFPMTKPKKIPDGVARWTDFRFNVNKFAPEAPTKKLRLTLDIDTDHRGDLIVILQAPGGAWLSLTNEEGADADDFVLDDVDYSAGLADIPANGQWAIRVQDRLKGDIATVKKIVLEIGTEGPETPAP